MKEIRFHGRGGQGIVTATETLALAAFYENKHAQSFPYFGAERRGAPVVSYIRFDDKPIRIRMNIHEPDCVVVLDTRLQQVVNVTQGLKKNGTLILNNNKNPSSLELKFKPTIIATVDATRIALEKLGVPITNMAMLGSFSITTKWVSIDSVCKAIRDTFKDKNIAEKNVNAAISAYENTSIEVN